ncbi:oxysterol-binding protein-related protein 3 isoform X1 [Chrysemys picta bellii]|uniref:Oxysterol-binding protein n=1 Tax=Chrysemys picta bellii TaxID=8478 RepID=A0A8C3ICZ6_CHRPI|nr:oxysterol-binding protein-related protein 3 isoform X1 [Chrysemys picta bellii]XP_005290930.1 oxysterol-binding protein-related protein 3 isoform X1 [Chrysemys picta bellii]XP_008168357.1 oxysterol-binding protein-related protein 3 isoform X1 [Chrysemys picta bellii]XP_042717480.1 oxysterol-binding protein-related protein 3 isoform X1 [Chrysemys picta bellii]
MSEEKSLGVSQKVLSPSRSTSSCSSKQGSRQDSWEVVEGLRGVMNYTQEPQKQEGYLLKKRKWPLKGWHKRYFFLDRGILKYAKCQADVEREKLHGCIDVGLSVMSVKKSTKCIDLDTEEYIYHLKVKSQELFDEWVAKLRHHRMYRQNEIAMFPHDINNHFFPASSTADSVPGVFDSVSSRKAGSMTKQNSLRIGSSLQFSCPSSESRIPPWLQSSEDMEKCSKDLSYCHTYLMEMSQLLQSMEVLHRTCSAPAINAMQCGSFESPKKEKRTHRRWRSRVIGKDAKGMLQVPTVFSAPMRLHASNPNLSTIDFGEEKNYSDGSETSEFSKMQEDLCHIAHKAYFTLKSAFSTISVEREKLKQLLEHDAASSPSAQIAGLKNALSSAIAQNTDLKDRLRRIHAESMLLDSAANAKSSPDLVKENSREGSRSLVHQLSNESRLSVTDSLSEFFDAQEVLLSASSSENEVSDDDSYASDLSDNISEDNLSNDIENERQTLDCIAESGMGSHSKRRTCLPAPCPNTSNISLWNILRNNIGKDLSKVAMPVELNEPLNTLQRLCEELEYSELLDKAALTPNSFERMVYVAAFAASAYASSYYRAGSKPFNPVLGETYECVREDKGFQFFSEQVSHHPPISACHAESVNFAFWQDVRWKNKFWGKSMEIVPIGTTHVTLPAFRDHFEWNKVTSCIHNILSGQRWIEHYGEIIIKNLNDDTCLCKLTFIKAKYWNPNMHEIEGSVMDRDGKVVHRLFGKWHENIYCGTPSSPTCIWRANPMPKDYEQCYGFTQFALELNELDPQTRPFLPPTDTRFRPDQRFLEEGNIEGAEMQKQRIEQLQRERRKVLEENNLEHQPRFFRKSTDDSWVSNGTYMDLRKDPGFSRLDNPVLW